MMALEALWQIKNAAGPKVGDKVKHLTSGEIGIIKRISSIICDIQFPSRMRQLVKGDLFYRDGMWNYEDEKDYLRVEGTKPRKIK